MPHAVVISVESSDIDPAHDYQATTPLLAAVLEDAGLDVDVRLAREGRFPPIADADLLVLNAGPALSTPTDSDGELALLAHLAAGRPILGMHSAAGTLRSMAEWPSVVGGRWVDGSSWHPPLGVGHVDVVPGHPIMHGVESFDVLDERYVGLQLEPGNDVLASHQLDAETHPLVWVRSYGPGRIVYDALGHDTRSYDSLAHRTIIRQAARFLTSQD